MTDAENPGRDEIALLNDLNDDFYGLWEVDWYFNGAHAKWSREVRIAFLSKLVQRGLIKVFFGSLRTRRPPLPRDIALEALADFAIWAPPTEGQRTPGAGLIQDRTVRTRPRSGPSYGGLWDGQHFKEPLRLEQAALICSVNRALLQEVGPALRAVKAQQISGTIRLRFFFDGEPSDNDLISASCAASEVISDFPDHALDDQVVRLDGPNAVPSEEGWLTIFERREPA